VQTPSGQRIRLIVRGIASDKAGLLGSMAISLSLARSAFSQRSDGIDLISYEPGVPNSQIQPAVNRILKAASRRPSHRPPRSTKRARQRRSTPC
jgi:hypothetical protein